MHTYQTFEEAQAHLQMFLEDVYNAKRLHSALDYVSPIEFEAHVLMCSCMDGYGFFGGTPNTFAVKFAVKERYWCML